MTCEIRRLEAYATFIEWLEGALVDFVGIWADFFFFVEDFRIP